MVIYMKSKIKMPEDYVAMDSAEMQFSRNRPDIEKLNGGYKVFKQTYVKHVEHEGWFIRDYRMLPETQFAGNVNQRPMSQKTYGTTPIQSEFTALGAVTMVGGSVLLAGLATWGLYELFTDD